MPNICGRIANCVRKFFTCQKNTSTSNTEEHCLVNETEKDGSLIDLSSNKNMKNLSIYEQIDILKCLNFDQLFSLRQTNYYFNLLIEQNKWILALKELKRIHQNTELPIYSIDPIPDVVFDPINDELLAKWQSAINKKIPLFVYEDRWKLSGCTIWVYSLKKDMKLTLNLTNYQKSIKEMKIIRFWLEQLFRCSFRHAIIHYLFNPEMIKLLFENNKNIPLRFYIKEYEGFSLSFHGLLYKNKFEFILNHLVITKGLSLNFHFCKLEEEQQHNILLELLLNSSKNIYCVCIGDIKEPLKLINFIINYFIKSEDCSEIVPNIIFGKWDFLQLKMEIKADRIEMKENQKIAICEYKNDYNYKIKYLAKFYYDKRDDEMIRKIKLKRIK